MLRLRWAMVSSSSADTLSSLYRAHRAVDVDGLGEVGVHARGEAFLNVLMVGVGCEGDDGDVLRRLAVELSDGGSRLQAVHHRHLHVHQDRIELFWRGLLDPL